MLQADQLKLTNEYFADGILSVDEVSYGAHLGIFLGFAQGYAECQVQARTSDQICCWTYFFDNTHNLPCQMIPPGTQHTVRIEISNLNPITFSFHIDGKKVGEITPERASEISHVLDRFMFHIISYANRQNHGFVDEVHFGQIR
jgi:hypothetical protein